MGEDPGRRGMEDEVRALQTEADELWETLLAGRTTLSVARHIVRDYAAQGGPETKMPEYLDSIANVIGNLSELRVPVAQLIEQAVLAERQACAKIAGDMAGSNYWAGMVEKRIMSRPLPTVTDTDCDLGGITP